MIKNQTRNARVYNIFIRSMHQPLALEFRGKNMHYDFTVCVLQ